MTYSIWTPSVPTSPLDEKDPNRLIDKTVWSLPMVQAGLRTGDLDYEFTSKAELEFRRELGWTEAQFRAYITALFGGRKHNSQWCFSPGGGGPYPCDAYLMGFDRFRGIEAPLRDPYIYIKFCVLDPVLLIFSAHPERP